MRGEDSGVSVKQRDDILHMAPSSVPWIAVDPGHPLSLRLTRQIGVLAENVGTSRHVEPADDGSFSAPGDVSLIPRGYVQ